MVNAIVGDFHDDAIYEQVRLEAGGEADIVLSDMGASATGHATTDHLRSAALAEVAFEFATEVLKENGAIVVKLLQGAEEAAYVAMLRKRFAKVDRIKPPASRDRSAEMYVVARGFRAQEATSGRCLRLACTTWHIAPKSATSGIANSGSADV